MKTVYLAHKIKSVSLTLLFLVGFTGAVIADPISDVEDVPATAAEMQLINRVISQVEAAVPRIDGWKRDVSVSASGNTVREGKPVLIFENARNFPLKINMQVNFQKITAAQEKQAAEEKSAQQLQEEMMAAANSGDMEKMQQLQLQLGVMMQKQMTAGPMGQAAGVTPMVKAEKPIKFYIQVIVNGDGETIGKQYDMPMSGVTRAFRIDKNKKDLLSYRYYLGAWEVSERDQKNWKIISPKKDQTAANHLKALVAQVNVYGDRDNVESYVINSLDLNGIRRILD